MIMGLLYLLACIILIIIIVVLLVTYIIPEIRSGALGTVQKQQSIAYENLVQAKTNAQEQLDWHPILITPNEIAPTYSPEQIAQLQEWFGNN